MAKFKYLSASLLALFLSLASCNSNSPAAPSDPTGGGGNPPSGGGEVTPPSGGEGETLEKASVTFSEELQNQEVFSSITKGAFTLSASKADGKNDPKFYSNGNKLRLYHGNTFTISGSRMTEINFNASYANNGTVTASVGSFESNKWTGDATSVTFTVGATSGTSGQFHVAALAINSSLSGGGEVTPPSGGGGEVTPPAPEGEHATFDFSQIYSDMEVGTNEVFSSYSGYGLTISAIKGSGSKDPTVYQNGYTLRLYTNNKFTVSGTNITRIDFDIDRSEKDGSFTASAGTIGATAWTCPVNSPVSSVTLTVASGQIRVKSLTIYATIDGDDIPSGGGGGGTSESDYTVLSVTRDYAYAIYEDYEEYLVDSDTGDLYNEVILDASNYTLLTAVEAVIDAAPDYLLPTSTGVFEDYWDEDETDPGAFGYLITPDEAIVVEVASYNDVDEDNSPIIVVQICAYENSDE